MGIRKDLAELVDNNVISKEVSERIDAHYQSKDSKSAHHIFIAFGVLGATLIGLGIILILAHNWDQLSRLVKSIIAFIPLVLAQILCTYTLISKNENRTWSESSSVLLFFGIGACISLISQIYNIPGNVSSFVITWMLLALPLVYLFKSSLVSLFYIIGITYYVCETGYWTDSSLQSWVYWVLLAIIVPHYYYLYKKEGESNSLIFHHWFIPVSITIALGTIADSAGILMFIAYFSLFGLFILIGHLEFISRQIFRNNSFLITGSLGTMSLLMAFTFRSVWQNIWDNSLPLAELVPTPEFGIAIAITLLASLLLFHFFKKQAISQLGITSFVFLLFIPLFVLGNYTELSVVLVNILVLLIGILVVRQGTSNGHLGTMNYGLLVITVLVICRFFDTDLNFIVRGILFVCVGIGFFIANYRMLKIRKSNDQ